MERESFVFYSSFLKAIRAIKKRDIQAELALAIIEYGITGETGECGEMVSMAMELIKPQIEANNQRYINGLKGAEHGVKGGRPRKEKPQENPTETPKKPQENPTETPKKPQENPTETPNVNVNENENENDLFQQTNKQAGEHEEKPKAENSTLKAYEDFNGDAIALAGWLSKRWNDAKRHYNVGTIGNVAILGNARMNLIEVAKNYTQGEIELAIKGVFIQKQIYPQFTLSPDKMLEPDHFSTFYNAGLTNTQLYNKEPQKGRKSSKNGVVRNIGDL